MPTTKLTFEHLVIPGPEKLLGYGHRERNLQWFDGAGIDTDAIHSNVSGEIAALTQKGSPVGGDLLLIEDSADSNSKKYIQITNLPGGAGGGDSWMEWTGL